MLSFKQFLAEMQASNDNPEYQNIKNAHTASAAELRKSLLKEISFANRRRLVKGLEVANKALPGLTRKAVPLGFTAGLVAGTSYQNPEIAAPAAVALPFAHMVVGDVFRRLIRKPSNKNAPKDIQSGGSHTAGGES